MIRAYVDANGDGTLDAGETTIAATDTTDAARRLLAEPRPGQVRRLRGRSRPGWTQSFPANTRAARGAGGWGITPRPRARPTPTTTSATSTTAPSRASKFDDLNANGARTPASPASPAGSIRAYEDTERRRHPRRRPRRRSPPPTPPSAGGAYSLTLDPGEYVVCEVHQAGWTQSLPTDTSACGSAAARARWLRHHVAATLDSRTTTSATSRNGTKSGNEVRRPNANGVKDAGDEPGSRAGSSAPTRTPTATASSRRPRRRSPPPTRPRRRRLLAHARPGQVRRLRGPPGQLDPVLPGQHACCSSVSRPRAPVATRSP